MFGLCARTQKKRHDVNLPTKLLNVGNQTKPGHKSMLKNATAQICQQISWVQEETLQIWTKIQISKELCSNRRILEKNTAISFKENGSINVSNTRINFRE